MGDNFFLLERYAAGKASVGLRIQNAITPRLVFGRWHHAPSVHVCWADPFSRIQSVFKGDEREGVARG